ncbi:MAG: eCIS core domain-containing protein [Alkalilacustris sp.]
MARLRIDRGSAGRRPATSRQGAIRDHGSGGLAALQRLADAATAVRQRAGLEEEELLQGKALQRMGEQPEEEELQMKPVHEAQANRTGLPDSLKAGVEALSGHALDDVRVHYNSSEPAKVQAHAYAQGTDIHLGPGQERHLPHEAWHVVQQAQGRVPTTGEVAGQPVNDDAGLEREADVMGAKARGKGIRR